MRVGMIGYRFMGKAHSNAYTTVAKFFDIEPRPVMKAICGRNESELASEVITPANVLQDLRLIRATGIGTIRLFSSGRFAETVLTVIRDNNLDLKVQLGAFPNPVNSLADEASNLAELAKCIELANRFPTIVLAVSVGNEKMVEWSAAKIDPVTMARYIKSVRDAVKQPSPPTTTGCSGRACPRSSPTW
ncbi:MAG: hypothetical protein HC777_00280, partial [Hyphomonadaceae bacterium]|nr:hypothetical protein [Hyphomonadaceae bacterium]